KGQTAVNIQNEDELIKFYNNFQTGVVESQNGQLIKSDIVEINGLKFSKFSIRARIGDELQIRHYLCVFVNNKTYSINFWELESMTEEMGLMREKVLSSIEPSAHLRIENQMSY